MQRLEIENRELRELSNKHFDDYRSLLIKTIELNATIELIKDALKGDHG